MRRSSPWSTRCSCLSVASRSGYGSGTSPRLDLRGSRWTNKQPETSGWDRSELPTLSGLFLNHPKGSLSSVSSHSSSLSKCLTSSTLRPTLPKPPETPLPDVLQYHKSVHPRPSPCPRVLSLLHPRPSPQSELLSLKSPTQKVHDPLLFPSPDPIFVHKPSFPESRVSASVSPRIGPLLPYP